MSPGFIARTRFVENIAGPRLLPAALWLFLYTLVPTALFAAALTALLSVFAPDLYALVGTGSAQQSLHWLPTLVINPVIETLILGTLVNFFARHQKESHAIMLAALFMAALHALDNVLWGVTVLSLFLIHGYAFAQLYRGDRQRAWVLPMLAHALHNGLMMLMLALV